ncbi:hypothetical protein H5410_020126 [Solanum commersonii]|uniref:Uncharacterized protein n=1 Tax=Solanum commersonii TaxID=4109 RepID=A0A9J5Z985_SOLCO|nr:hypothetical protein H5410_020126 [Solanum commersonii]
MLYDSECWTAKVQHIHKRSVAEMWMLRWMCSHTKLDKTKTFHMCQKVQVTHSEDKVREGSLRSLVMSCVDL